MKTNRYRLHLAGLLMVLLILGFSCRKVFDTYRNSQPVQQVSVDTYAFLQAQKGIYDSLLYLLDITGLADTIKNDEVTFFAIQDISILTALKNVNVTRGLYGDSTIWTLDSIPVSVWRSMLERYILDGIVSSDSLNYADGVTLHTISDYEMNGKRIKNDASGIVDGGPFAIQYSDMDSSRFVKDWISSATQAADVRTSNGMVHVLESKHTFGFDAFVGEAFPRSLITKQDPYSGFPAPIPGVIEAADFDFGGEGISYHDQDANNAGGQYRSSGVDIEVCSEGGYDLGWTNAGEWLKYTVDVQQTGWYYLDVRVASPNNNGFQQYSVSFNGKDVTGIMGVPWTNNYQSFTWRTSYVYLEEGVQEMQFNVLSCCYNFSKYRLTPMPGPPPAATPFGGTPAKIPGHIIAGNYDNGGQGIGYNDMDPVNSGGQHRPAEGVDILFGAPVDPEIGWTFGGEWLRYTVNVEESGTYKIVVNCSSPNGDAKFHFSFDGVDKTGKVSVPNTGDYQNFTQVETTATLEAGIHVMEFYLDVGFFDFSAFDFIKQ